MSKSVAKKEEDKLPAMAGMFEQESGAGFENADRDSYAIPFLALLQKMSPQVDSESDAYVEGARPGHYINTVDLSLYDGKDQGVLLVPCHYVRVFIEWVPRDAGGGFVAEHPVAEGLELMKTATTNDQNRDILPNGNELLDTRMHYVLVVKEDGSWSPAVMSMTRTAIKASKSWMSLMKGIQWKRADGSGLFTPPMFSHVYRATVQLRTKDQNSWYVPRLAKERPLGGGDAGLFDAAKAFRDQIVSGEARAAYDTAAEHMDEQCAAPAGAAPDGDDMPF